MEANNSSSSLRPFEVKLFMLQCAIESCLGLRVNVEDEDNENDEGVRMLGELELGLGVDCGGSPDPADPEKIGDKGKLLDSDSGAGASAENKKLADWYTAVNNKQLCEKYTIWVAQLLPSRNTWLKHKHCLRA